MEKLKKGPLDFLHAYFLTLLCSMMLMSVGHAATITVTSDADDGLSDGCELRDAIAAANADAASGNCAAGSGNDAIAFSIPGCGPGSGTQTVCVIQLTSELPIILKRLKIDGSMPETRALPGNPTKRPGVELDGSGIAPGYANALQIFYPDSSGSEVRGLVMNHFSGDPNAIFTAPPWATVDDINGTGVHILNSDNNIVAGNYFSTNHDGDGNGGTLGQGVWVAEGADSNVIGGENANDRNVMLGVFAPNQSVLHVIIGVQGSGVGLTANNNHVLGNYMGVNAKGERPTGLGVGQKTADLAILNEVGRALGAGGQACYNGPDSCNTSGTMMRNNVIKNCGIGIFLGTFVATELLPNPGANHLIINNLISNADIGVALYGAFSDIALKDNVINNIVAHAIFVLGDTSFNYVPEVTYSKGPQNVVVHNNLIGVDKDLNPKPIGGDGINFLFGGDNFAITRNVIANTGGNGVVLFDLGRTFGGFINSPQDVSILENSIYNNGWLGIDLQSFFTGGVTDNDLFDADDGPNKLQNYPVLEAAAANASGNHLKAISGTLDSLPGKYRIEFFVNETDNASGHGSGEKFAGFVNVTILDPAPAGGQPFTHVCKGVDATKGCPAVDVPTPLQFLSVTATATKIEDQSVVNPLARYGKTSEFAKNVPLN